MDSGLAQPAWEQSPCQLSIVNCLVNCQLSAPATARVLLAALLELQKPTGDTLDIRSVYPQLCP
jgi:hypothetical protein